jgi:hypothetical protein
VAPEQLLPFNSYAVLLLAGLAHSVASVQTNHSVTVHLSVSNFLPSQLSLSRAHVQWVLRGCGTGTGGTVYRSGVTAPNTSTATQGVITALGGWSILLPPVTVPTCVYLQIEVVGASCAYCSKAPTLRNGWSVWVLPKAPAITRPVYYFPADLEKPLQQTGLFGSDLRPLPNSTSPLPAARMIYIVAQLTPQLQAAMDAGATVLCVRCPASGGGSVAYGPGLWATMGPGGARGVGSFMPAGTPLEPLAHPGRARWLDFSWFQHVEGAQVQPIDPSPPGAVVQPTKVLLRWLNAPCAYSGPLTVFSRITGSNKTFANGCQGGAKLQGASYALLSDTTVGNKGGRLIWSGLNLFPATLPPPPPPVPAPVHAPSLGFCPATNFSACKAAVHGDFLGDYSPDHEHVELHVAASTVTIEALYLDMQGVNPHPINRACNPHQQPVTVRGVIYSDECGRPGKLLAWTNSATLTKNATRSFVRLPMQSQQGVTLLVGKYWLGNHIGAVCAVMWGSAASAGRNPCVFGKHAYVDGPASNFPTTGYGQCSGALSVFATYRQGPLLPTEVVAGAMNSVIERTNTGRGNTRSSSTNRTGIASSESLTPWILSLLLRRGLGE